MTERFVCLHGHFYQPPRENPWLEAVEVQDSAYPYHDWNERVTAECYAPNAAARILDGEGRIARIVDNYSRISFDFGPTLLAWMETARPEVYRAVLEADRRSAERFSGHGSAMAQAYGHLILPLASRRDKETQVLWGIRDFEHRFGRRPEGLWLPETAVDTETLEVLAEHGIAFTVLAPHQAARVRELPPGATPRSGEGEGREHPAGPPSHRIPNEPPAAADLQGDERPTQRRSAGGPPGAPSSGPAPTGPGSRGDERPSEHPWHEVPDATVDPTRPYLCRLPSGRSIALFFYDGGLAREIAFGDLLRDGEGFAGRLLAGAGADPGPRLIHAATDGETYGHHHRYGDMALAYALERLERAAEEDPGVRLTNYAEHLARHPPEHEVEIVEASSWSCAHGVERWRSDCGCHTGGEPGWTQGWRRPLREALDRLRDELAPRYEEAAGELFRDPWAARNDAVELILDRSEEALDRFLEAHAARELTGDELLRARRLLELQRHAMTMFTSCGWFFNDLAGIETVQVLQYAGRALQLGRALFGDGLEERFLERLDAARSNRPLPHGGTGREIFEREVRPARVTLDRVGAHYALSSLFEDSPEEARIFCYHADQSDVRTLRSGRARLALGRLRVASRVTGARAELAFAVLHFGDHNLSGGVRRYRSREEFEAMAERVARAFRRGDLARAVRVLDEHFEMTYSLDSLFRDERRAVLDRILAATRADAEERHRRVYEDNAPLMQYLAELGIPLPLPLKASAEVFLNLELRRAFEDPAADLGAVDRLLRETSTWNLDLDTAGLAHALQETLERLARSLEATPDDLGLLERLRTTAQLAVELPFPVSLHATQEVCYRLLQSEYPARRSAAGGCDPEVEAWAERFRAVAETLRLRVE